MSRRRPGMIRRLNTVARAEAAVRHAQHELATATTWNEHLQQRVQHLLAVVDDCERVHGDLARRNSHLQQANCALADRCWKAEQAAAANGAELDRLVVLALALRHVIRDLVGGAERHDHDATGDALRRAAELLLEEPT